MTAARHGKMPVGWDAELSDEYEWAPLRLPPEVTRISASTRLSIEAEYRGWELTPGAALHRRKPTSAIAPQEVSCRERRRRSPRSAGSVTVGQSGNDGPATYAALRRLLFLVPAERIHGLVFAGLRGVTAAAPVRRQLSRRLAPIDPVLSSTVFGVHFPGPLGLAAGFDKDGTGLDAWGAMGFGYAEVGTVTAQAQPGNPPPRLFRLPDDRALLNRMGFNNHGADALAARLAAHRPDVPIGVNIGKTKTAAPEDAAAGLPGQRPMRRAARRISGGQRELAEHSRTA